MTSKSRSPSSSPETEAAPEPPRPTLFDRIAGLPPAVLLLVAMTSFTALSVWSMRDESLVVDELAHLPAGYSYAVASDFRLNQEHPPLAKMLAGIAAALLSPQDPFSGIDWEQRREWDFGWAFFFQCGNDADRLLFAGRCAMLFWPLLLIGSVYAAARELFGPKGALISLVLTAFNPMLLAHGHLVNTDVPVATMMFLAAVGAWRFFEAPGALRAAVAGVLLGGALATKFSAVFLVVLFFLFLGIAAWKRRETFPPIVTFRRAGAILLIAATAWTTLWGAYRFRYSADPEGPVPPPARLAKYAEASLVGRTIQVSRHFGFLPEAFLDGFTSMHLDAQGRRAYAWGQYSNTGWWWYFPVGFLVKNPVGFLLLAATGLWGWSRRSRTDPVWAYFLVAPLFLYWLMAIGSQMNIGLRHILPVYPPLLVLAAATPLDPANDRDRRVRHHVVLGLLGSVILGTLMAGPYYLAYFNAPSLAVWKRHEMLVDSNLDWGQDLRRLARFREAHPEGTLHLAYFGHDSPRDRDLKHRLLAKLALYDKKEPEWEASGPFAPGDYVAVSATHLVGALRGDRDRDHFLRLVSGLDEVARIGHSIIVYRARASGP